MSYVSPIAFFNFLLYFVVGVGSMILFAKAYILTTPYNEIVEINDGHKAPAMALGGSLLGFALPVSTVIYLSRNVLEVLIWALITGIVQLVQYKAMYRVMPIHPTSNNQAVGVVYAFVSVSLGLIGAVCLIPG